MMAPKFEITSAFYISLSRCFREVSRQRVRFPHAKHSTSTCWSGGFARQTTGRTNGQSLGLNSDFQASILDAPPPPPSVWGDGLMTVQYETEESKLLEGGGGNCIPCGTDPEQDCSTEVFSNRSGLKTCTALYMEGKTMRPSCPRQQNT